MFGSLCKTSCGITRLSQQRHVRRKKTTLLGNRHNSCIAESISSRIDGHLASAGETEEAVWVERARNYSCLSFSVHSIPQGNGNPKIRVLGLYRCASILQCLIPVFSPVFQRTCLVFSPRDRASHDGSCVSTVSLLYRK